MGVLKSLLANFTVSEVESLCNIEKKSSIDFGMELPVIGFFLFGIIESILNYLCKNTIKFCRNI